MVYSMSDSEITSDVPQEPPVSNSSNPHYRTDVNTPKAAIHWFRNGYYKVMRRIGIDAFSPIGAELIVEVDVDESMDRDDASVIAHSFLSEYIQGLNASTGDDSFVEYVEVHPSDGPYEVAQSLYTKATHELAEHEAKARTQAGTLSQDKKDQLDSTALVEEQFRKQRSICKDHRGIFLFAVDVVASEGGYPHLEDELDTLAAEYPNLKANFDTPEPK